MDLLLSLIWHQDHEHRATFHGRLVLNRAYIAEFFRNAFEGFHGDLGVVHFSPAELDAHFDFVPFFQPPASIAYFEDAMALACLRSETNLLDFDLGLGPARLALLFLSLVDKLPEIHHPAYGGLRIGGDFDKIQAGFFRYP